MDSELPGQLTLDIDKVGSITCRGRNPFDRQVDLIITGAIAQYQPVLDFLAEMDGK